jgi:hypothetical protein
MPAPRFYPGDTVACEVDCEWENAPAGSPQPGQLYGIRHSCWLEDGYYLLLDGARGLWAEAGFCAPEELPVAALDALRIAAATQAARDAESIARRAWTSKPKKLKKMLIHAP